jgi:hypothetical protein
MRAIVLAAGVAVAAGGFAQEKPAPPGLAPTILLASAAKRDGKVVVQIAHAGVPVPPVNPKDKPTEGAVWVNLRPVTLGETVQAYGVDGERVEPEAVVKALAEPKGVAVFVRSYPTDPVTPPAFYRSMFREGTIILVVKAEDLYHPKP